MVQGNRPWHVHRACLMRYRGEVFKYSVFAFMPWRSCGNETAPTALTFIHQLFSSFTAYPLHL